MKTALLVAWKVLGTAGSNLLSMMVSWKFIKWGLKLLAKQTSNKIDDAVIDLVDAAYVGDSEKVKLYAEKVLSNIKTQG